MVEPRKILATYDPNFTVWKYDVYVYEMVRDYETGDFRDLIKREDRSWRSENILSCGEVMAAYMKNFFPPVSYCYDNKRMLYTNEPLDHMELKVISLPFGDGTTRDYGIELGHPVAKLLGEINRRDLVAYLEICNLQPFKDFMGFEPFQAKWLFSPSCEGWADSNNSGINMTRGLKMRVELLEDCEDSESVFMIVVKDTLNGVAISVLYDSKQRIKFQRLSDAPIGRLLAPTNVPQSLVAFLNDKHPRTIGCINQNYALTTENNQYYPMEWCCPARGQMVPECIRNSITDWRDYHNFEKADQQAEINGAANFIWAQKESYEHMGITLFPHGSSRPSSSNSERLRYSSGLSSSTSF
ncbi:unnamed protein product [Bursaphelenchus okinawaensis]|uniref:Uncharacterized protein n=1 Tax=Bursaphelenchus okinawaensis TaxID=465554 RepID=A0A811LVR0_9BILA|nr:unnamed protein product [Bursaphelenchus okinawaensis]CAG9128475.1 unnamed protein product [Bursaphelenchus okinawaensis]